MIFEMFHLITFVLTFVVVMIISVFAIKKQWKKDNQKIKIVTEAEITDKQNKRGKFYVTFKLLGGDSIKLKVSEQEYDRIDIGYYGKVTFKDKTYLGFARGRYE